MTQTVTSALNASLPDQTLTCIKSELEQQLVELRLDNHLKDERLFKLTASLSRTFADNTLRDHLRKVLSQSQFQRIVDLLGEYPNSQFEDEY